MSPPSDLLALPRWSILPLAAIVVFATLWGTTGPTFINVSVGGGVDGMLLLLWVFGGIGIGSLVVKHRDHLDPLLVVTSQAAIGLGTLGILVLILGLRSILSQPMAIGLLIVGVAMLANQYRLQLPTLKAYLVGRSRYTLLAGVLSIPLALIAATTSLFPGLLWKPLDPHPYDVMSYHLQVPREWFDAGRIIALHHNVFGYFPMGVEVHDLLAMHLLGGPWAAMYLCQMMSAAFGGLAVLATVGGARQLGAGRAVAWSAGLALACVPWTLMLSSVAYVESAVMLYAVLAAVWSVIGLKATTIRPMAIAGAMAGFACGVKYTAVAMTLLPLLAIWPIFAWPQLRVHVWRPWLAAAVTATVVFSPWLIRNAAWTGNPTFPLMTGVFGRGEFTADQVDRFRVAHMPPAAEQSITTRLMAAKNRVVEDWQFGFGWPILSVAAIILTFVYRQHLSISCLTIAAAAVWLLATHDMPRFLAPVLPITAVVLAVAIPRRKLIEAVVCSGLIVQAGYGIYATWRAAEPTFDLGRQGFFRLPSPGFLDAADLVAAKASGAKVALIGEAQAFFQELPSSRLLYRNVFDVAIPPGGTTVDNWLGEPVEQLRREGYWVIINPDELVRLSRTYAHIPVPMPPYDQAGQPPIVLPPISP